MCLHVPGKVIHIEGDNVLVDYDTEKRKAKIGDVSCNVGDWVVVVGQFVVDVVEPKVGRESLNHWKKTMLS